MTHEHNEPNPSELIAILSVVVASIVQVAVTSGPFTFWNLMIGIVLGAVLLTHGHGPRTPRLHLAALAGAWGLTLVIGSGVGLQELYDAAAPHADWPSRWRFDREEQVWVPGEAPSGFYFAVWVAFTLAIFGGLYLWTRRTR